MFALCERFIGACTVLLQFHRTANILQPKRHNAASLYLFSPCAMCYGLPVRLLYIVITCARIDSIKRVCSEPPCCPGAFLDLVSIHDNFGDENGILGVFYCGKSERNS